VDCVTQGWGWPLTTSFGAIAPQGERIANETIRKRFAVH
jgi:hypothetical protein